MALVIERDGIGFKVRAKDPGMGRSTPCYARTVLEVAEAVRHYYADATHSPGHCPFCRMQADRRTVPRAVNRTFKRRSTIVKGT